MLCGGCPPIGRLGKSEEVAAAAFLASQPAANHVLGHSMAIGDILKQTDQVPQTVRIDGANRDANNFSIRHARRSVRRGLQINIDLAEGDWRTKQIFLSLPRPTLRGQSQAFSLFSDCGLRLRQICLCGLVIALSDKDENRVEDG
jgi:hypothetical protein